MCDSLLVEKVKYSSARCLCRKIKRKQLLLLFVLGITHASYAQRDPVFTQYLFNHSIINPAYVGHIEDLTLVSQNRLQWLGMESGAPVTYLMTITDLLKNEINGVGGLLMYDHIGVTSSTQASGMFSHRIILKKATLSLGMQGGFVYIKNDNHLLNLKEEVDVSFPLNGGSAILPNFGFGAILTTNRYYAGVSIPRFISNPLQPEQELTEGKENRFYMLNGGIVVPINENLKVKPNFLLKYTEGSRIQYDLNTNFLIYDVIWLGVSYRSRASLDLISEIVVKENLRFGYSYDISLSQQSMFAGGAHEIMLQYKIKKKEVLKNEKPYTPRYF